MAERQAIVPLVVRTEHDAAFVEALRAVEEIGDEVQRRVARAFLNSALPLGSAVSYQHRLRTEELSALLAALEEVVAIAPSPVLNRLITILRGMQ